MEIELANELQHLNKQEIEELYDRYIEGEKIQNLLDHYKVDTSISRLYSLFPPMEHKDKECPYCDIAMYSKRRSKSAYQYESEEIKCLACNHKITNSSFRQCRCSNCEDIRREDALIQALKKKNTVQKQYDLESIVAIPLNKLGFLPRIQILSLIRSQAEDKFKKISSFKYSENNTWFAPNYEESRAIIQDLLDQKLLLVDISSDLKAFSDESPYKLVDIEKPKFIVNISTDGKSRSSLSEIYHAINNHFSGGLKSDWKDDVYEFIYWLAREEVYQFISYKLQEHNLINAYDRKISCKNKLKATIETLLNNFSVSNLYYFSSIAVRNANSYYTTGKSKGKPHAVNTIPENLLGYRDKAIAENWDLRKMYSGSRTTYRSMMNIVFYDGVLNDIDLGFRLPIESLWKNKILTTYFQTLEKQMKPEIPFCLACGCIDVEISMTNENVYIYCTACTNNENFINSKAY